MPRTKGAIDLLQPRRGVLIELKKTNNLSNQALVERYYYNKNTVQNVLKRAENAEKENINLLSLKVY